MQKKSKIVQVTNKQTAETLPPLHLGSRAGRCPRAGQPITTAWTSQEREEKGKAELEDP